YANRVQSFYDQTVADVYGLYQRRLFASNAVDFDDLLMLTVDVLERFPEAREKWENAFRYILVDEYQDTNHAQYRLLQLLAEKSMNLCAVGDPDQSIYGWRGAEISNILDFERDFPGTRTIALEQNYRSTNSILRAANSVIEHNRERKPKELFSELGEGEPVRVAEVEDEHAEARFVAAASATRRSRVCRPGRTHRGGRSGRRRSSRRRPASALRRCALCRDFARCSSRCSRARSSSRCPSWFSACSIRAATSRRSRPSGRSKHRDESRTCRSSSASRASTRRRRTSRRSPTSSRRSRSTRIRTRSAARRAWSR